jgi:hypothetical protein
MKLGEMYTGLIDCYKQDITDDISKNQTHDEFLYSFGVLFVWYLSAVN